jgi:hypothetical protein
LHTQQLRQQKPGRARPNDSDLDLGHFAPWAGA